MLQRVAAAECGGVLELPLRLASEARHGLLERPPQQLGRLDLAHLTPVEEVRWQ
jgi:hypothetical protein